MLVEKELILGGAQIGQAYGSIRMSSFSRGDKLQMLLDKAKSAGFTAVDTARTYGRSEELLGEHIWDGQIHTKLDEHIHPQRSLSDSLDALKLDSVDVLYVCHDASRVSDTSHDFWGPQLSELGVRSRALGAAVYSDQLDFPLLGFTEIQIIQVPFNVLSSTAIREKITEWKLSGKTIYIRSIFAQGYLVGSSHRNARPEIANSLKAFHGISRRMGMDPAELAFRWTLAYPQIDGVILGISDLRELELVNSWRDRGALPEAEFLFVESKLGKFRLDIDLRNM